MPSSQRSGRFTRGWATAGTFCAVTVLTGCTHNLMLMDLIEPTYRSVTVHTTVATAETPNGRRTFFDPIAEPPTEVADFASVSIPSEP